MSGELSCDIVEEFGFFFFFTSFVDKLFSHQFW